MKWADNYEKLAECNQTSTAEHHGNDMYKNCYKPTGNFSAMVYVLVSKIYYTLRLYLWVRVSFFFHRWLRWKMKLDFHQCVEIGEKSVAVSDVVLLLL